jgi:nucleoside-diphosphate-sugar epimerase
MELRNKRAFVTGITGTVGSRIAHRLLAEGMQVRALVRRPEAAAAGFGAAGVEWVQGDITDAASVAAAMAGADLVVHSAAYIGPDEELSRRTNVDGTRNMVAAALQARPELFRPHLYDLRVRPVQRDGVRRDVAALPRPQEPLPGDQDRSRAGRVGRFG